MKILAIACLVLGLLTLGHLGKPALADGDQAICNQTINLTVNGMVCDFCAQALDKVLTKKHGIEKIDVNLDQQRVALTLIDGQVPEDDLLHELIDNAGYQLAVIERGCEAG